MMHDAGFERMEELFHAAMALPLEERGGFLRVECGGDEAMRQELEEMLRADGALLDVPVLERLGGEELEGRTAGRWRIGRRIGEGGLGLVHEAEDGETGERAAIKFLRPGLDAGAFRRRFLKERRILGALRHRNIARLLDGGVDAAGRAYLAMEYVDGMPLDEYLAETRPGGTTRLELFIQICQAAQYLHTALVAHGDLKPSNIFVGSDGQVKVLDFGAARLLAPNDTMGHDTTMTRAFLTPHYASPEQRQGDGPSVRSDIYALGVMLGEAYPAADGDMAAIRDHCVRPEAEDRYGSVLELEQDLRRYEAHKPVRARRQNARYRAAKFFQRHAAAVGLAAALAAAAGTGTVFLWRELRRDEERLAQMRAVVRGVLNNASQQATNGGEDRRAMRDTMEAAIRELESPGEKGMELELSAAWRRLGGARMEEGDGPGGIEALRRSYELAERAWERRREQAAFESMTITMPLWALARRTRGESGESMGLALRAVALHEEYKKRTGRPLPPQNRYYRMTLLLGPALARKGKTEEGRALLAESLDAARLAGSAEYTGRALIQLAILEQQAGQMGVAKRYCEEAARVWPVAPRLEKVCVATPLTADEQIAAARLRIGAMGKELGHDPERFQTLRKIAAMHRRLGILLHEQGREAEAGAEIGKASAYLEELAKKDPGNMAVQKQVKRARQKREQLSK